MSTHDFPYPLKSWTLGGFRAIQDETTFNLGGLNILVGANSAGKSSVLQSLLLVAQTLSNPTADRPLVLNGNLVRLGWASDCVHEQAAKGVTIGFGLNPAEVSFGQGRPAMNEVSGIDVRSAFTVDDRGAGFELARTEVIAQLTEESGTAKISVEHRADGAAYAALTDAGIAPDVAEQHAASIGIDASGDIPGGTVGAYLRQFLPDTLAVVINAYKRELNDLLVVVLPRVGNSAPAGLRKRLSGVSEPVAEFIGNYLLDQLNDTELLKLNLSTPLTPEGLSELPPSVLTKIAGIRQSGWYSEHLDELPKKGEVQGQLMLGALDVSVDCARYWFSNSLHHLGPLRAAPQPLYSLPEAASGASVGKNGEYTAAVLNTYGKQMSVLPMPDGGTSRLSLAKAVDRWVSALGLLAAVKPRELGKYGFELTVNVDGVDRPLDLTSVGVGVSQALPIIVLGLISEPGSTLLFEQPELHLHPDVQAALGDFFLALARTGRQLIIETHSEYLINRLRRRQVTDSEPDAADLVRLFFFERAGPAAKVSPARIGPDGSMPGWPTGFLDTAAREIEATVLGQSD
jgi:predicted ATPase